MNDYRKAKAVALYDSQVLITIGHEDHMFHEFTFGELKISGFYLDKLTQVLGIETFLVEKRHISDVDFEILEPKVYNYGVDFENCQIAALEIKIEDYQSLSIKITEEWPNEVYIREISYCGKYSIEWLNLS